MLTLLSLTGVVLNIKKNKLCFVIWTITNATWCLYDLSLHAYAQSALFAVYFILAIWGLIEWRH